MAGRGCDRHTGRHRASRRCRGDSSALVCRRHLGRLLRGRRFSPRGESLRQRDAGGWIDIDVLRVGCAGRPAVPCRMERPVAGLQQPYSAAREDGCAPGSASQLPEGIVRIGIRDQAVPSLLQGPSPGDPRDLPGLSLQPGRSGGPNRAASAFATQTVRILRGILRRFAKRAGENQRQLPERRPALLRVVCRRHDSECCG